MYVFAYKSIYNYIYLIYISQLLHVQCSIPNIMARISWDHCPSPSARPSSLPGSTSPASRDVIPKNLGSKSGPRPHDTSWL